MDFLIDKHQERDSEIKTRKHWDNYIKADHLKLKYKDYFDDIVCMVIITVGQQDTLDVPSTGALVPEVLVVV